MNVNLQPKTPAINTWIRDAAEQLADVGITSALLDAELILAHTLRKSRTWIHAHGDELLHLRQLEVANARLDLRCDRTPLAYILGHKEFYGRLFKVSPATLIPRPESEDIITLLNKYFVQSKTSLLDIGTGSGCLGITAKLEHPSLDVTLTDISQHALSVAERNATNLGASVKFIKSDLLNSVPGSYDYIIANLPYVDRKWERSPETNCEPPVALFAEKNGTALILKLIGQSTERLNPQGILLLEADACQHNTIIDYATNNGLVSIETLGYIIALQKA